MNYKLGHECEFVMVRVCLSIYRYNMHRPFVGILVLLWVVHTTGFCLTRTGPTGLRGPPGFNGTNGKDGAEGPAGPPVGQGAVLNITGLTTGTLTVGETKQFQVNAHGTVTTTGGVTAATLTTSGAVTMGGRLVITATDDVDYGSSYLLSSHGFTYIGSPSLETDGGAFVGKDFVVAGSMVMAGRPEALFNTEHYFVFGQYALGLYWLAGKAQILVPAPIVVSNAEMIAMGGNAGSDAVLVTPANGAVIKIIDHVVIGSGATCTVTGSTTFQISLNDGTNRYPLISGIPVTVVTNANQFAYGVPATTGSTIPTSDLGTTPLKLTFGPTTAVSPAISGSCAITIRLVYALYPGV